MALATLSIDLEARLANLQSGFDKASRLSEKTAADIQSRFDRVNASFGKLGVVLGAAFAGTNFTQFITSTAEGLDKLKDLSDATGSSVENLSALEDVALRTGTSFEDFAGSVVKFNKALIDAKDGAPSAEIFEKLGLDLAALKKEDPSEALRKTAVALSTFADDGDKARVVQQLFGKSVQQAAPFLKELADQTELVAKVTTQQAEAGERFNKNLLELQKNSVDLARTISGPLIESLNTLTDRYKLSKKEGEGFFSFIVNEYKRVAEQQRQLTGIGINFSADLNAGFSDRAGGGRGFVNPPTVGASSIGTIGGDKPGKAAKEVRNDADEYLKKLQEQYVSTLELTTAEKALVDIRASGFKGLTPELEKLIVQQAEVIDQDKAAIELRKRLTEEIELNVEAERAFSEESIRTFEAVRTPVEKFTAEIAKLRFLLDRGSLDSQTFERGIQAARDKYLATAKDARTDLDEFTKNFVSGTQNIFASTFENLGTGGFKNIDKEFSSLLLRLSSQAAAADLTKRLFGEDGKGIEDIGKRITEQFASIDFSKLTEQFSSLFSGLSETLAGLFSGGSGSAGGGFLSSLGSLFAGGFADGGFAAPNKLALVGERGPELIFTGNRGTTVRPMSQAPAQRPMQFVINQSFAAGTDRTTVSQAAAQAARAIQAGQRNL